MSHYLTTLGYVLKSFPVREADRRYVVYTQDYGKIDFLARGTRKVTSKLAGNLQPFRLLTLQVAQGKRQMHVIGVSCEMAYSFAHSPQLFGYAQYCLELIDTVTQHGQRSDELFNLLGEMFVLLEQADEAQDVKQLRLAFLLKVLYLTGFSPRERLGKYPEVQQVMDYYLQESLADALTYESNGSLKKLFTISQTVLNEVVEKKLISAEYLQRC